MSLLDIIRQKLLDENVGNSSTWKVYIGYAPDDQDQIIALTPSGGFPDSTQQGENVYETFQVKVRSARRAYTVCENKWREMFAALHDADLSDSDIALIQAMATGPLAWYDENTRPNMSANFRVIRTRP